MNRAASMMCGSFSRAAAAAATVAAVLGAAAP